MKSLIRITYELIRDNVDLTQAYLLGKSLANIGLPMGECPTLNPHQKAAMQWGYEDARDLAPTYSLNEVLTLALIK